MSVNRHINRYFIAWLAVFAILCDGLMPSLSQIRAADFSAGIVEICHIGSDTTSLLSGSKSPLSPLQKFTSPHCGYCVAGVTFATPSTFMPQVVAVVIQSTKLRVASIPNRRSRPRLTAFSRGPPLSIA